MTHRALILRVALGVMLLPLGASGCGTGAPEGNHRCYYDYDAGPRPDAEPSPDAELLPDASYARVTLLHTSDLHHHARGYGPQLDYTPLDTADGDRVLGGYSRLAGLIGSIRETQEASGIPVLVVDSGDFLMGTVYDMTVDDPVAFRYFQMAGYDAITLGNHEFDWTPVGLAMLIENALVAGFRVPIVASNTRTDPDPEVTDDDALQEFMDEGVIVDRLILDLPGGLRVGLLGRLGPEGDTAGPMAPPVTFDHRPELYQTLVDELRADGAHLVLLLSHGGIGETGRGDDPILATQVEGIDVILSGHTHVASHSPTRVGQTIIYAPGAYGQWLSRLDLTVDVTNGLVSEYEYALLPVDDTVTGDATVQAMVETHDATLNALLGGSLGLELFTPVVEVPFDLDREEGELKETALCNFAADALRRSSTAIAFFGGEADWAYAAAVFPAGAARDPLLMSSHGYATFADLFNVVPLGISADPDNQDNLGWPLLSIYVTPAELRGMAEVTVSLAPALNMPDLFICFSGVRVTYDPNGPSIPPDRVRSIRLCGNALESFFGGEEDYYSTQCTTELDITDDTTLLRVVTDFYSVLYLTEVAQVGIHIEPKFANGTPVITSGPLDLLEARIDLDGDPNNGQVTELKTWMSLLEYVFSPACPDLGGIPGLGEIPDVYNPDGEGSALGRILPQ